jgi:hypothetical protein
MPTWIVLEAKAARGDTRVKIPNTMRRCSTYLQPLVMDLLPRLKWKALVAYFREFSNCTKESL